MITKHTASQIAYAYSEIEAAENLLKIFSEAGPLRGDTDFRDVFGRRRNSLQFGVPSGENGHRLLDVSPALGEIIIKAHIEAKRAEIAALCELAKTELREEGHKP